MASHIPSGGEGATGGEGAAAPGDSSNRTARELVREEEQRAATALREAVERLERERDYAMRALREQLEGRVSRVEVRMCAAEGRLGSSAAGERENVAGGQGSVEHLETRMVKLEAGVQKALDDMFPRVAAVLSKLEDPSSTATTAATATCNPASSSSTAITVSAAATTTNGDSASSSRSASPTGDRPHLARALEATLSIMEERERERRMRLRKDAIARASVAPSSLGEELCRAAQSGNVDDVRRLLDAGADVDYMSYEWSSALLMAVERDPPCADIVALLLRRGASVNAVDYASWTALHTAVRSGDARCVQLLIDAGADVNAREECGITPLHLAAANKMETIVRALLAAGARRDVSVWNGHWHFRTPRDVAITDTIRDILRP